jgi:hypothetical protein
MFTSISSVFAYSLPRIVLLLKASWGGLLDQGCFSSLYEVIVLTNNGHDETVARKQRFAKALYLKRVPRVRIPPSPVVFPSESATGLNRREIEPVTNLVFLFRKITHVDAPERRKSGGIFGGTSDRPLSPA